MKVTMAQEDALWRAALRDANPALASSLLTFARSAATAVAAGCPVDEMAGAYRDGLRGSPIPRIHTDRALGAIVRFARAIGEREAARILSQIVRRSRRG